jgi:hypothetical protein
LPRPGAGQQLAGVEHAVRVGLALVFGEGLDPLRLEELHLGDADAVLAGDHAAEVACELHHRLDQPLGRLHHRVVVRVHRDVGVHIAVAGVHVQRNEQAAGQDPVVNRADTPAHGLQLLAVEDLEQRPLDLAPVRDAQAAPQQQSIRRSPERRSARAVSSSHSSQSPWRH